MAMAASAGNSVYRLAFELSPIILVDGIAAITGSVLPIIALTEAVHFPLGLLTGGNPDRSLDDFFAHYRPLPGSTMISNQVAHYPFANNSVAANAVISQPNIIAFQMICPAKGPGGAFTKLPTMLALQQTLQQHSQMGGTFLLLTPSMVYTNCLLLSMRDTSTSYTKQDQNTWQLDFERPLLTLEAALAAQTQLGNLMNQMTNGEQIIGQPALSGLQTGGSSTIPLSTSTVVPAAQNISGVNVGAGGVAAIGSP